MPDMKNKSTMWSGTQFNIKAFADQQNAAAQQGWTCLGQLEETKEGRPHYQFAIKTPHIRMSQVVKTFQGAHIEVCRNKDALLQYVVKEETRIGELPAVSNLYPSLDAMLMRFCEWAQYKNIPYDREGQRTRVAGQFWLEHFDTWVDTVAIPVEKLRVESLAVNPATRSLVKRYMNGIYGRTMLEKLHKLEAEQKESLEGQTDRQTSENIIPPRGITNDASSSGDEDTEEQGEEFETEDGETITEGDEDSSYEGTDSGSESDCETQ